MELVQQAARAGAELIVLPEMFNCPYSKELFPLYAESYPEGITFATLAEVARSQRVWLVGGSVPEREGDRIYNSAFVFNPEGQLMARHRKAHLFDVELPNMIFKESATLVAGNDITLFSTPVGEIGVLICYDLRFPEMFRLLVERGAVAVVIPAAFNMVTGPAHWEVLLRARAVDNQVYVLAVSPARDPAASYVAYGHSMAVDPWGEVVARAGAGEEIVYVRLEREKIKEIRQRLPLLKHRRLDLYQVVKAD